MSLPPRSADLPLFNVKLVLVSGRVSGPLTETAGKDILLPFGAQSALFGH